MPAMRWTKVQRSCGSAKAAPLANPATPSAMSLLPSLLLLADAATIHGDTTIESLCLEITGVVLAVAIGAVAYCLKSLANLRERVDAIEKPRLPHPMVTSAAVPAAAGGLSPELIAVIAASVHVALGSAHRIVSLQPAHETRPWSVEGRRQIFHSHQVR